MAQIKLSIVDDHGERIGSEREYLLEVGSGTLAEIEQAVEQFRQKALPQIERELLEASQKKVVEQEKKEAICNATEPAG